MFLADSETRVDLLNNEAIGSTAFIEFLDYSALAPAARIIFAHFSVADELAERP